MAALLTALASLAVYRLLPAAWLCDFGEQPEEKHRPEYRCPGWKTAVLLMWFGALAVFRAAGRTDFSGGLILAAAFVILMTTVLSDCDYRIIPDQSAAAMLLLGAAICALRPEASLRGLVSGALLAMILVLLSAVLGRIASRQEGIGAGDGKLMTACGACVGTVYAGEWAAAVLTFYALSVLSAAAWFAVLLLCRRTEYGDERPMAPWIAAAALLCLAVAPPL